MKRKKKITEIHWPMPPQLILPSQSAKVHSEVMALKLDLAFGLSTWLIGFADLSVHVGLVFHNSGECE